MKIKTTKRSDKKNENSKNKTPKRDDLEIDQKKRMKPRDAKGPKPSKK